MLTPGQKKVVERTLEKFKNATGLSSDDGRCLYSHNYNKVGCGIGCHTENKELAEEWDDKKLMIGDIFTNYPEEFKRMFPELKGRDDSNIQWGGKYDDMDFLYSLQGKHDNAANLSSFRQELEEWLALG